MSNYNHVRQYTVIRVSWDGDGHYGGTASCDWSDAEDYLLK
jgi:hypothetical protein